MEKWEIENCIWKSNSIYFFFMIFRFLLYFGVACVDYLWLQQLLLSSQCVLTWFHFILPSLSLPLTNLLSFIRQPFLFCINASSSGVYYSMVVSVFLLPYSEAINLNTIVKIKWKKIYKKLKTNCNKSFAVYNTAMFFKVGVVKLTHKLGESNISPAINFLVTRI